MLRIQQARFPITTIAIGGIFQDHRPLEILPHEITVDPNGLDELDDSPHGSRMGQVPQYQGCERGVRLDTPQHQGVSLRPFQSGQAANLLDDAISVP
ncbi:hypothetical protein D3C84_1074560 [compost metagenome]